MNARRDLEVCPNCGEWVDVLLDATGWCAGCSDDGEPCRRCGHVKPHNSYHPNGRRWIGICRDCRTQVKRDWRALNRERQRAYDHSYWHNVRRVRAQPGTTPIGTGGFVECGPGRGNGLALAAHSSEEASAMLNHTPKSRP